MRQLRRNCSTLSPSMPREAFLVSQTVSTASTRSGECAQLCGQVSLKGGQEAYDCARGYRQWRGLYMSLLLLHSLVV